ARDEHANTTETDSNPAEAARLTRRQFVQCSALTAGALALPFGAEALQGEKPKAKVVVVTTKATLGPSSPPSLALVEQMLEKGITALAGKSDPLQAWETFVRKTDTVCLPTAGGQLENVPEVNIAVYRALARLGVNKMTIGTHRMSSVWHTTVTDAMKEQMPELISNKLFGVANLPMDAIVVTPTVKHHDIAGISGTLKLYACFSKLGPWNYHGETPIHSEHWDGVAGGGMGACGWVPANDFKTQRKLHVVDMIRIGGSSRGWVAHPDGWVYTKSLVLSTDPVAADRVAFDLYMKVAQPSGRLDPMNHVLRAESEYKAGVADLKQIDVRRVTV
ncbi:MAG TPA: DUF362 domain-containing protein, partial [Chthonomonadaceae bacterium]|nr:DUF362 domain-containing protein [Chthonomonadaceae bacterium]